jgi:hypothetical protein
MAKKKAAAAQEPKVDAPAAAPEKTEEADVNGKNVITVKFKELGQVRSREFSREVHGPDFKKLAEEFKATNAARIVE